MGVKRGVGVVERVAINATGRARGPELMAYSVNAGRVIPGLRLVTTAAVDRLGGDIVVRVFGGQISMATGAGVRFVDISAKSGFIYKQRDCLAGGVGFKERFVRMTLEAGAVGDLECWRFGILECCARGCELPKQS